MIKLFRHIRKSLISEGKTARYFKYAIGEILLVVVGILIALQINTWNEQRKDRKEELVALKDLKKEFESNLKDVDSLINYKGYVAGLWESYLSTISSRGLSDEERSKPRPRMGSLLFSISNSTLNSLLNTGKIDKIRNDSLKYLLSNWNDILNFERSAEQIQHNFVQDKFLQIELKLIPNEALSGISGTQNFFHSKDDIQQMRLRAIDNLEYQNAMEYSYHLLKIQFKAGQSLKTKIKRVIDLLTDEISKRED